MEAVTADRLVPLFVVDPALWDAPRTAPARRWFLAGSLAVLDAALQELPAPERLPPPPDAVASDALLREPDPGLVDLPEPGEGAARERFDPHGTWVRAWVPELAALPAAVIHRPWSLSPTEQHAAGVVIGRDYPAPLIDLAEGRERALAAFKAASSAP